MKNFDKSDAVTTPSQEQPNTEVDTPEISQKLRRRIRRKTRPDTIQNCSSFAEASHVSNFSLLFRSACPTTCWYRIGCLRNAVLSLYAQWLLQAPTTSGIQQALSRSGVALIIRKGSVWQARQICLKDTICAKHFHAGRLLLVQIFFGKGE